MSVWILNEEDELLPKKTLIESVGNLTPGDKTIKHYLESERYSMYYCRHKQYFHFSYWENLESMNIKEINEVFLQGKT